MLTPCTVLQISCCLPKVLNTHRGTNEFDEFGSFERKVRWLEWRYKMSKTRSKLKSRRKELVKASGSKKGAKKLAKFDLYMEQGTWSCCGCRKADSQQCCGRFSTDGVNTNSRCPNLVLLGQTVQHMSLGGCAHNKEADAEVGNYKPLEEAEKEKKKKEKAGGFVQALGSLGDMLG